MKLQKLLVAAWLLLGGANAYAQQPLNLCCHPENIRNWQPGANRDDAFNVSKVPLARRFKEAQPMQANSTQRYGGEICNSTILYPMCSLCPSQGEINNFLGYQPTYWQYMDKLVYWAGAASEGIINIPPAGSTDAAHAQGVKSLGNIFFPPTSFGGQSRWVREMLEKDNNGKYIFAEKLYQLCKYFNFDGWFINEETYASTKDEWVGFFRDFYAAAARDNNHTVELQWYDASYSPNVSILNTHANTSHFIEYNSVRDYRSYSSSLNCTPEQTLSKIYAGVQCVYSGHTGWMRDLNTAMPADGPHVASLDLFCPEERIWADAAKAAFKSASSNHGAGAYTIAKKVFENDEDMWVNHNSDPSNTTTTGYWKGVSSRVLERSAIMSMPFMSDMGVGNGKYRFVEGEKQGTADWYHSGMQSILPTWRWWITNRGNLTVTIDWDNAYNVGSSFKVAGTLTQGDHIMRLYKTKISVTNGGVYRVVYKSDSNFQLEAKISTNSSVEPDQTLQPKTIEKNGWKIADFDLTSLNGKTIYMLALNLKAVNNVSDFSMNLGQVAVLPANYQPEAPAINNFASTSVLGDAKGDVRLTWEYNWSDDFDHFDIYVKSETGEKQMVGQTRGQAFYIPEFPRNGGDKFVDIDLVPVMKSGVQKTAKRLQLAYPALKAPQLSFTVSPKSYCTVGTVLTINAKATAPVTTYNWTLPEGLELAEGTTADGASIKVVATSAGKKTISVTASNSVGESTTPCEVVDVFANEAEMREVHNVVAHKTVVSYSGKTNDRESPINLIDGIERPSSTWQKWCNISPDNEVVFDCQGVYRIYGFKFFDGNAGPEKGVEQSDRYTIEVSMDKNEWTKVVDREGVDNLDVKDDNIAPVKGRYVRFKPHVNGTLRIWEFQVFGRADNNMTVTVDSKMEMNAEETKNIVVRYALNGDKRENSFTCEVTPDNENVKVGTITENAEEGTFTIPVTAAKLIGTANLSIRVTNGGAYKEAAVNVIINSTTQPNILSGQDATVHLYEEDYSLNARKTTYVIKGLTDGNSDANALEDIVVLSSTHTDDVWAVFTAPTDNGWNLSKIKVTVPNLNQGFDEEQTELSSVNNRIKIAVGNDLNNLDIVETFDNLEEFTSLEYVFPEFRNAKYIAIICNVNPLFYGTLAEVEAYEQYAEAVPSIAPMELTGWTHDVLVEATPADTHASGTLDSEGWAFYTTSVKDAGAIAGDNRKVHTRSGMDFVLGDYTKNNAVVLKPYVRATLTAAEPVNCEEIYILAAASNGSATIAVTINYDDNTNSGPQNIRALDWYANSSDGTDAVYGLGRIKVGSTMTYSNNQIGDPRFRLFEFTLPADKGKKVKSLGLYGMNWMSWGTVLAVSRKGTSVTTGITDVNAAETSTKVVGIYSLDGMKLNAPVKGINIFKYADGTTKKVMIQ